MYQSFDFDKALKALRPGQALIDKNSILTWLIKQLTEAKLTSGLNSHLATDNEASRKTVPAKSPATGNFELSTPHDRNAIFAPQLVKKYQQHCCTRSSRKLSACSLRVRVIPKISREI